MKVWEYMNKIKGTDASLEQIKAWSYMNKVCPLDFKNPENALEIDGGISEKFVYLIRKWCDSQDNCSDCFDKFFELELPDGFNREVS